MESIRTQDSKVVTVGEKEVHVEFSYTISNDGRYCDDRGEFGPELYQIHDIVIDTVYCNETFNEIPLKEITEEEKEILIKKISKKT